MKNTKFSVFKLAACMLALVGCILLWPNQQTYAAELQKDNYNGWKTDRHIGMITVYWHGQKKFMIHRQMHGIGLKQMEQWQGIRMSLLY